jgi:hypothetical protein
MNFAIRYAVVNRDDVFAPKPWIGLDASGKIAACADLFVTLKRDPVADFALAGFDVKILAIQLDDAERLGSFIPFL